MSNAGGKSWILPKPVLLELSLVGNLEKTLMSLYGTKWKERGYELRARSLRGDSITVQWSKPDFV